MQRHNWIARLKEELLQPLPGIEAQLRMSPTVRRPVAADIPLKNSGVLLLLYMHDGYLKTVFIKRTVYNGVHSGQISLPGGMFENSDGSLCHTALRETMEETGMPMKEASIIGKLTSLHIPVSNINVFPFVAVSEQRPEFSPDPTEVQYLIETNIEEFFNPLNKKKETIQIAGTAIEVPYFDIRGNHIWGATAMIVSEFLEIVNKIGSKE
jgi:8-oxo-dGTP pyrophosphatase MutT (NUDIX family)